MKDATYWAEKIKSREISLEQYYHEVNKKINEINPKINAIIEWDYEKVLQDLKKFIVVDDMPFAGMPIPLKMLDQEKEGWSATVGAVLFANRKATKTSNFVKKLESIGFLPAGQTNVPELGLKNVTDAKLYGHTRNIWNLDHTPGGSSGGAASVVASGILPIATASDGGGSIRIPASYNGLIGLKPTRGAMPNGPGNWRCWQGAAVDFAMTVSMRDTEKLFYALRGNESASPYHPPRSAWEKHTIRPSLKIAYLTESPIGTSVSKEAKLAIENGKQELQKLGHELTEITWPIDGVKVLKSYFLMNSSEVASMFSYVEQMMQKKLTDKDMDLMTWGFFQYGEKLSAKKYLEALSTWDKAAEKMENLFSQYDLFLTPTTAYPAPRVDQRLFSTNIQDQLEKADTLDEDSLEKLVYEMCSEAIALTPYSQLANLTGQPAISLPTHITQEGLPLGIQFMASKGREDLLLHIGKQLESQNIFKLPKAYSK